MANKNKRTHARFPFGTLVRISKRIEVDGTGIDLGVGGVAVHVAVPISEGSPVEVDLFAAGAPVPGVVRQSVPHPDGGFRLGIEWRLDNGELAPKMS